MSVVTVNPCQFIRLFGGTLSLAVGSTLMSVLPFFHLSSKLIQDRKSTRNNSLRTALSSLSLTSSAITTIIDDPTILGSSTSRSQLAALGLTPSQASYALTHGYIVGFKFVFILNACLAGVATVSSIFMIKHKELIRADEQRLRAEARQQLENGGNDKQAVSKQRSSEKRDPEAVNDALGVDVETGSGVPEKPEHA